MTVTAAYDVQIEGGKGGSEGGAHGESVGVLGEVRVGPERRHRRRVGDGRLKKTVMASATQLPGSNWCPGRSRPASADLVDVPPHAGDVDGRDNDGEAVVIAQDRGLEFEPERRGAMGDRGGNGRERSRVSVGRFCRAGEGHVVAIRPWWPWMTSTPWPLPPVYV